MLSDNIKLLRAKHNMTIKELSVKSGVGQSTISDIETGKAKNPRMETLQKLANVFNVDVGSLLNTEEKLKLSIDSLKKINNLANDALNNSIKEKTYKEKEIDTIAAHLEEKNLTPKKVKLLKDYIDALFDDEEW
ncbi:helix-turn-helix domain-containing protein [Clostridium baratii]|uniref:helix-turn-helix domain-containing protein n=1 Tax=Clostridium baratii TaxID=1561 RepID=UPI0006BAC3D9|nr:helix-turn-helix transcriptional regulator [Clostridium baratii]